MRTATPLQVQQNAGRMSFSILRITCFFWIIAKVISYPAWLATGRLFPVIPVYSGLSDVFPLVHTILFGITSALIFTLLLFFPKIKTLAVLLLLTEIASCLLDVARWQPWEYQYLFILFIFCYSLSRPKVFYNAMVFLTAAIYIFSGLHKFNGGFLYTIWENMMLKGFFGLQKQDILHYKLHYAGLMMPVIETLAGIALLVVRNKKWPATVLIGMHVFNLVLLGPFGLNYNIIVWPWNVAMICYLYVLFIQHRQPFVFSFMWAGYNRAVLLCFGLLPVLSFFGYWEGHFSSNLYSGNTKNLAICVEAEKVPELKQYFAKDTYNVCGDTLLKVQKWSFAELNLPPYPEEWYYRKLAAGWNRVHPGTGAAFLLYQYPYKVAVPVK